MVAQMLLLTLLWSLFLTFVLWEDLRSPSILTGSKTYDAVFTLVQSMNERPQERTVVLDAFSKALREGYGGGEDPALSINLIVRQNKALIYSSAGAPTAVTNTRIGEIQRIQSEGRFWTSRTLKSDNADVEVTLVTPAAGWNFFFTLIRVATTYCRYWCAFLFFCFLRGYPSALQCAPGTTWLMKFPYERQTISPLKEVPKHRELRQMVDAINVFLARVRESTERERVFIADAAHELRTPCGDAYQC
jgi:hypothetical protein